MLHILGPEVFLGALGRATAVDVVEHHALRQQLGEGLIDLDQAQIAHDLGPEACVQQVQDGVFHATDVLVHGHPVVGAAGHHLLAVLGVAIAHEVPGRVHEGVHGVGLTAGRLAAAGADYASMEGFALDQRIARAIGYQVFGQHYGQVFFRHGLGAAVCAVDDGDRRAPVALAAHTPVTQTPGGFLLAQALGSQQFGHLVHGLDMAQAVQLTGVHTDALLLVAIPFLPCLGREALTLHGHDLLDGQSVLVGKGKVTLVMGGNAHDGAVAIAHQHIVAHPHLDLCAGEGMRDEQARRLAQLLLGCQFGFGRSALLALSDKGRQLRLGSRCMLRQRVLRRHGAESHAHDGVGTCGEDIHLAVTNQLTVSALDVMVEGKAHASRLADPVFLHQAHLVGPAVQRRLLIADLHMVQQLLCVVGDGQVVAGDLALFHQRAGAPATAVDHLLVGQHGLVHRVPVHDLGLAVGDALFQHLQEQPLVPLVVIGVTGGDFARPVDGQAHGLHLLFHVRDVVVRPLGRRHLVLQRRVLGGQAEGVPAHGHQDVVALHAQLAREHVVDGVVAHVAHVQLARGVGQHGAGVVLGLGLVFSDAVGVLGLPMVLRGALDLNVVELFLHVAVRWPPAPTEGPGKVEI